MNDRFSRFHAFHRPGNPLVLVNAWDAGSARTIAQTGAPAIATSSWAVSQASGFEDGEHLPVEMALKSAERIVRSVDVPVSIDFESGYGSTARDVAESLARLSSTGAVGCNLEDKDPETDLIRPAEAQADRLRAAREGAGAGLFINARTDLFLQSDPERHAALVTEAAQRSRIYADAGADGLFVPGLIDPVLLRDLVSRSPLPINVMITDMHTDLAPYRGAGVARVSFGPAPYLAAMASLDAVCAAYWKGADG